VKIAFLDRDGVINKEVDHLYKISEFEYTYRCKDALKLLINDGFSIIIVTNQAGIGKGLFTEKDYDVLTNFYTADLRKDGIRVLEVLHCPHYEFSVIEQYRKKCVCRKPSPGMILAATERYDIDLKNSILVGDKVTDVQAGQAAGIAKSYLVQSGHNIREDDFRKYEVFPNLYELATNILGG